MKKLLFAVIVLICLAGALFAGSTYWFGMRAEQQYLDTIEHASQAGYIQFTNESYDRGFLQSEARTTVGVPDLGNLTLVHVIRHGPLPLCTSPEGKCQLKPLLAAIETSVELSPELRAELKEVIDEFPEIGSVKSYTSLSLTGDGVTRLSIPPMQETVGKENVAVIWEGLTGQITFTADLKEFKGAVDAPGLEAVGDKGNIRMTNLQSAFNIREDIQGLFLGDATFDLGLLEVAEKEGREETRFSMRGLKMMTKSEGAADTINYAMTMQVDKVMADDTPYGPGAFEMELRKIDAASLAKLQKDIGELQAEFSRRPPKEVNQMMLAKYAEALPELMKASPEVEIIQVKLKTGQGDFFGKAKIVVDGSNAAALANPLFLLSAVKAHAELTVTDRLLKKFFQAEFEEDVIEAAKQTEVAELTDEEVTALATSKTETRLAELVEKNILVYKDGNFKASADYRAGTVTLNGRPVTLQDLQGLD
jgi:uncharacterized protein YdgA (DUF945 family)